MVDTKPRKNLSNQYRQSERYKSKHRCILFRKLILKKNRNFKNNKIENKFFF